MGDREVKRAGKRAAAVVFARGQAARVLRGNCDLCCAHGDEGAALVGLYCDRDDGSQTATAIVICATCVDLIRSVIPRPKIRKRASR